MPVRALLGALCALLLAVAAPAHAAIYNLYAQMSGPAENPPNASPGTGLTLLQMDTDARTLSFSATFQGLLGTTRAAHVHCCINPPGNVGVATQLPSFTSFPLGVSSGSFTQFLDMNVAASWNPAFVTANGGTTASAFSALTTGLLDGRAYFNVHTTTFPGGEIRGFFQVPEPGVLALLGGAVLLLALTVRRAGRRAR